MFHDHYGKSDAAMRDQSSLEAAHIFSIQLIAQVGRINSVYSAKGYHQGGSGVY